MFIWRQLIETFCKFFRKIVKTTANISFNSAYLLVLILGCAVYNNRLCHSGPFRGGGGGGGSKAFNGSKILRFNAFNPSLGFGIMQKTQNKPAYHDKITAATWAPYSLTFGLESIRELHGKKKYGMYHRPLSFLNLL